MWFEQNNELVENIIDNVDKHEDDLYGVLPFVLEPEEADQMVSQVEEFVKQCIKKYSPNRLVQLQHALDAHYTQYVDKVVSSDTETSLDAIVIDNYDSTQTIQDIEDIKIDPTWINAMYPLCSFDDQTVDTEDVIDEINIADHRNTETGDTTIQNPDVEYLEKSLENDPFDELDKLLEELKSKEVKKSLPDLPFPKYYFDTPVENFADFDSEKAQEAFSVYQTPSHNCNNMEPVSDVDQYEHLNQCSCGLPPMSQCPYSQVDIDVDGHLVNYENLLFDYVDDSEVAIGTKINGYVTLFPEYFDEFKSIYQKYFHNSVYLDVDGHFITRTGLLYEIDVDQTMIGPVGIKDLSGEVQLFNKYIERYGTKYGYCIDSPPDSLDSTYPNYFKNIIDNAFHRYLEENVENYMHQFPNMTVDEATYHLNQEWKNMPWDEAVNYF